ncbi:MAG: hypothetical protein MJ142_08185 [Clostridia bacterium]|nr:hypothetical protein [Clostridia bacterium]
MRLRYSKTDQFSSLGYTLLRYMGNEPIVTLPSEMNGVPLREAAYGVFNGTSVQIFVPEGYERWSDCLADRGDSNWLTLYLPGSVTRIDCDSDKKSKSVFFARENLRLIMYNIQLTENEFRQYYQMGIPLKNGDAAFIGLPDCIVKRFPSLSSDMSIFPVSPAGIFLNMAKEKEDLESLFCRRYLLNTAGREHFMSECDFFLRNRETLTATARHEDSERFSDWQIRKNNRLNPPFFAVSFLKASCTEKTENGRSVSFETRFGYHFFPVADEIKLDGECYYIYSRCYVMSPADEAYLFGVCPLGLKPRYYRRDVAVFDQTGPLRDTEKAMKVYEKYKLTCIL